MVGALFIDFTFGWREVEADAQECSLCFDKAYLGTVLRAGASTKGAKDWFPIEVFVCSSCKDQLGCP